MTVPGWVPDDNYFHLPPGGEKTVLLERRNGQGRLQGFVQALNGGAPVRIALPAEDRVAEGTR